MTDVSTAQAFFILASAGALFMCGFSHGKWFGIQKAEARHRLQKAEQRKQQMRQH